MIEERLLIEDYDYMILNPKSKFAKKYFKENKEDEMYEL